MILNENDRNDLIYVMRSFLLGECKQDPQYFGEALLETAQFIREDATYEQMLNLVFNTRRQEKYLPGDVLEAFAVSGIVNELENMYPELLEGNEVVEHEDKFQQEMVDVCESFKLSVEEKTELLEHVDELLEEGVKEKSAEAKASFLKMYNRMNSGVKSYLKSHPNVSKYGKWVAGSVAVAGASSWVYKKFLSANAKRCAGKIGSDFKQCITNIKLNAEREAVRALRTAVSQCNRAGNPMDCKSRYSKAISKHEANMAKLKE
jgi:hypothetical protein